MSPTSLTTTMRILLTCLLLYYLLATVSSDCPSDCYQEWDQGTCINGTCNCTSFYTGSDCSFANDTKYDWDFVGDNGGGCTHGGRFYPPYEVDGWLRWCVCPYGWTGLDCSLCAFDDSCGSSVGNETWLCEKSIFIHKKKYYNCSVTSDDINTDLDGQGVVTASCELPDNKTTDGTCSIDLYIREAGVPKMFGCTFEGCSVTVEQTQQKVHCETSSCKCTSFCNSFLEAVINQATTTCDFICDNTTKECVFTQAEIAYLLPSIPLSCQASECLNSFIPTPTKNVTPLIVALIVSVSVTVVAALIGFACFVTIKKFHKPYRPLPHIEATLSFHNICCTSLEKGKVGRRILHDISGNALPGNITAIIGASGAGKTTFLDIIAGRKNTGLVSGDIFVNGEPRTKVFKRLAGYVTQDDVFMGTLTVREYLMYNAMLRLPPHMTKEQKDTKVSEVLLELGIAHIANSRIGTDTTRGISGGERKRLAIAAELIVDPSILILDEPTSGLDSYSASSLISTLSNLAHGIKKRTIIMTIHQPRSDIYHKFDYLMVLSKGRAVYYGPAQDALSYFTSLGYVCPSNFNPADFIIDTVSTTNFTETMGQIVPTFDDISAINSRAKGNAGFLSKDYNDIEEYASPFWVQFQVLTHRTFLNIFRNPFLLKIQYSVTILVALALGYLYWQIPPELSRGGMQNRMGSLFFICTLLSFGSITSIDLFFSERLLFLRERANGCYRTSAYFLAKAVSDMIPMRVLPPLIMGCIVYYMVGFNPYYTNFLYFLATLVLVSMTSTAMCFVISTITPSVSVGNMVAILLLFFFLLFGGFLINYSAMPAYVQWITKLSFLTYGFTILMINEFGGITVIFDVSGYEKTPVPGTVILSQVGMNPKYFALDFVFLVTMMVTFLVAAFVLLRFIVKERR